MRYYVNISVKKGSSSKEEYIMSKVIGIDFATIDIIELVMLAINISRQVEQADETSIKYF